MQLLGDWNWWAPRWLTSDRSQPRVTRLAAARERKRRV
jgi:uncharacterized membrane protein YdfJ with MMPL/SSD domain